MAEVIRMPLMSDTMTEGVVVEWHKKIGDTVKTGDLLAEIETDKATMELESYQEGTLLHIGAQPGDTVPVNSIIAILGKTGEDFQALLDEESTATDTKDAAPSTEQPATTAPVAPPPAPTPTNTPPPPPAAVPTVTPQVVQSAPTTGDGGRIKISPLAKRLATENNIDLTQVQGTGDAGRIIKRDIEQVLANPQQQSAQQTSVAQPVAVAGNQETALTTKPFVPAMVGQEGHNDIPNSQMRKVIARRLGESKFTAPHFYLTMSICMDKVMAARKQMNELSPVKISFNDIIIKAAALSLRQHPQVNASWMDEFIRYNQHINIGMAVAVDEGLLVPIIRLADMKGLSSIAAETKELAGKARNRKLQPAEMSGNTFTISNLGMMDIDEFTAIINPPDACIMAVGKIEKLPKVDDEGEIVVKSMMKITLSCDHRVVDGAVGAKFLNTFKSMLEEPYRMMV